jgi:hypothetical protein
MTGLIVRATIGAALLWTLRSSVAASTFWLLSGCFLAFWLLSGFLTTNFLAAFWLFNHQASELGLAPAAPLILQLSGCFTCFASTKVEILTQKTSKSAGIDVMKEEKIEIDNPSGMTIFLANSTCMGRIRKHTTSADVSRRQQPCM